MPFENLLAALKAKQADANARIAAAQGDPSNPLSREAGDEMSKNALAMAMGSLGPVGELGAVPAATEGAGEGLAAKIKSLADARTARMAKNGVSGLEQAQNIGQGLPTTNPSTGSLLDAIKSAAAKSDVQQIIPESQGLGKVIPNEAEQIGSNSMYTQDSPTVIARKKYQQMVKGMK